MNSTGRKRSTVIVCEKERNDGPETRVVPIVLELRPHVERARAEADVGAVYVFPDIRSGEEKLRVGLLRVLKSADIHVWIKLCPALRASRETEWMRQEANPAHGDPLRITPCVV